MSAVLKIAGADASSHGVWISGEPREWLDAPRASFGVSPLTGRIGGIVASTYEVRAREPMIPIRIIGDTPAERELNEQWLKSHFLREVVVQIDDGTTPRQIRGRLQSVALAPLKHVQARVSYGAITMLCGDPRWQALTPTSLVLSGETAIPMGNAVIENWALTIEGDFVDATIVIKNGDGDTLHTMVWTGDSNDTDLVIDASTGRVLLDGVTSAFATYVGGFPSLDPYDEPTITVTVASGSVDAATLAYRELWY
jgi:hypothetical protein